MMNHISHGLGSLDKLAAAQTRDHTPAIGARVYNMWTSKWDPEPFDFGTVRAVRPVHGGYEAEAQVDWHIAGTATWVDVHEIIVMSDQAFASMCKARHENPRITTAQLLRVKQRHDG